MNTGTVLRTAAGGPRPPCPLSGTRRAGQCHVTYRAAVCAQTLRTSPSAQTLTTHRAGGGVVKTGCVHMPNEGERVPIVSV
jgi:hypothetical protein